ncbi:b36.1 [miniopterid betaherpesvirus 1]|uniref:B36.1 n=1 Tax=miniopterid betaherpesvirus 1 TaxID=3070189 RepID=I3VQG8_9BETA|nr:b36.1 [miniopterid betaherpesvirus 1]AFK84012.1 b36.1 [miniopterid betaherpesvirus 1]
MRNLNCLAVVSTVDVGMFIVYLHFLTCYSSERLFCRQISVLRREGVRLCVLDRRTVRRKILAYAFNRRIVVHILLC